MKQLTIISWTLAEKSWFLDFEGYTEPGKFWVKELCIMPSGTPEDAGFDEEEHYNYFIKSEGLKKRDWLCHYWQQRRHGLRSDFGDYFFDEAIRNVQLKIGNGKVLVKCR